MSGDERDTLLNLNHHFTDLLAAFHVVDGVEGLIERVNAVNRGLNAMKFDGRHEVLEHFPAADDDAFHDERLHNHSARKILEARELLHPASPLHRVCTDDHDAA